MAAFEAKDDIVIFRKPSSSVPATVAASGQGAVSVGGSVNSPITTSVVTNHNVILPAYEASWPLRVGLVPARASAFQQRDHFLASQPDDINSTTRVLSGGAGVGKSQLAAQFASEAVEDPGIDLVVWVSADTRDQIIATYARCAHRVGATVTGDVSKDATAFLEWLQSTERAWLIVLDDITDPAEVAGWWPPNRPKGRTLATTRLRDTRLTGSSRQRIDIDVYTMAESDRYLTTRLEEVGRSHLLDDQAAELAEELGHLPLALSHAAAYMENQEESCGAYLARYRNGRDSLAELMPADYDPDGYNRSVAVTLLISLDAADAAVPVGLSRPALAFSSMLNPAGHPEALWMTDALAAFLAQYRNNGPGGAVGNDQARQALRLLHRYALVHHTSADSLRAVRVHALTARAMRETLPDLARVARVAADALLAIWPQEDYLDTGLVGVLQANAATLIALADDPPWHGCNHRLIMRAGNSLLRSGQHEAAEEYWSNIAKQAQELHGPADMATLSARLNLASARWQAGHAADAIVIEESVFVDHKRARGRLHPATLIAGVNLAASYRQAARTHDAIALLVDAVSGLESTLGSGNSHTLAARTNLASCYAQAGQFEEAIVLAERVVTDWEQAESPDAPMKVLAEKNLAAVYLRAGRKAAAANLFESILPKLDIHLGVEHPETLGTRAQLAIYYVEIGRTDLGLDLFTVVVPAMEHVLGAEHPETLIARGSLASCYMLSGRTEDAVACMKAAGSAFDRVLGSRHEITLLARMMTSPRNVNDSGRR